MKKWKWVLIILATIVIAIVIRFALVPYVYRDIQVAKLERYVHEADLNNGWGESYNLYGVDYYLLNRDDVLTLLEIVKKLSPAKWQLLFPWSSRTFYAGNVEVGIYDDYVIKFGFHDHFEYRRGNDGLDWPTNSERFDDWNYRR